MSRIMNYILKREEEGEDLLSGSFEDYLAPEVEAPRTTMERDFVDRESKLSSNHEPGGKHGHKSSIS